MTRRLDFLMLLVVALAAHGCADDDGPPNPDGGEDGGEDGGPILEDAGPDDCTDGETLYFVVNSLSAPLEEAEAGPDGGTPDPIEDEGPGFNIDESTDPVCGVEDLTWRGEPGVDNGLLRSFGSTLDIVIQSQLGPSILSGEVLLLVKLDHVNVNNETGDLEGLQNDNCITLSLLLGLVPEDEDMVNDAGLVPYLDQDMDGVLDSDLTLDIDNQSFVAMGEPLISSQGSVSGGRVGADTGTLSLSLGDLALDLENARVEFAVDSEGNLTDGVIGGAIPNRVLAFTLVSLLQPDSDLCEGTNTQEAAIEANGADIDPETLPDGGVGTCQKVSVGFGFGGVPFTPGTERGEFTDPGSGDFQDPCDVPDGGVDGGTDAGMDSGT